MSCPRSKTQWMDMLSGTDAKTAARRILGDLTHYMNGRSCEADDIQQVAAALEAFAALRVAARFAASHTLGGR